MVKTSQFPVKMFPTKPIHLQRYDIWLILISYNYHIRNQNIYCFPYVFPQKPAKNVCSFHPPRTDLVTWGRPYTDHGQPQEQRGQARTELAQLEAEASRTCCTDLCCSDGSILTGGFNQQKSSKHGIFLHDLSSKNKGLTSKHWDLTSGTITWLWKNMFF